MTADFQSLKLTKPNPNGPFQEETVDAIHTSVGSADAGKLVVLNSAGLVDSSMGGGGAPPLPTLTAGVNISAYQVITIHSDGMAYVADAATVADANIVMGVAITSASVGNPLTFAPSGEVDNSGFLFTPGARVYLGLSGALVETVPTHPASAFELSLGVAASSSKLFLEVGTPILLA